MQLGFFAFNRFYKISAGATKDKTYDDFAKSSFYNAFVKFGSFLNNVKPLYMENYIDWVIKSGTKLDHWCRDDLYEKYVLELIKKESVETALERSIQTMIDWSNNNKPAAWNHYFHHVNANLAVWNIKDGKISPWLILNSDSGKKMLANFNDEQLSLVYHILNPDFWSKKFKSNNSDVELVKQIIEEAKI